MSSIAMRTSNYKSLIDSTGAIENIEGGGETCTGNFTVEEMDGGDTLLEPDSPL